MKKILAFVQIIFCFVLLLTGCSNPAGSGNTDNTDNTGNNGNKTPQKLTVGYMSNFMVDIGDATGLGISKRKAPGSGNARAAVDNTEGKNYLVKTTVDFSHGNVEWDDTGLTNVTFKKKTTVDEAIFIPKADETGAPVYLAGEDGKPLLDEAGNPIPDMEIIENQTVTQDEIPAQVNRLYVHNTFTYIQFIPNDTSQIPDTRPADLGKVDGDGYYAYDKRDYYNDDYHQSFVIENNTGNIYSVENNVHIAAIHNGLLNIKGSSYIWDCRIKANNELEIFTLFQNTAVAVYDYFKDKYGNNYIENSHLDTTVTETSTIFFSNTGEYSVTENTGDVVHIGKFSSHWKDPVHSNSIDVSLSEIRVMGVNLTSRAIASDDYFEFEGFAGWPKSTSIFSHIKNNELFIYRGNLIVVDTGTGAVKHYVECRVNGWYTNIPATAVSYDTVMITSVLSAPNRKNLYYFKVDFSSLAVSDEPFYFDTVSYASDPSFAGRWKLYGDNLILVLENPDDESVTGPWKKTSLNGQDEYQLVLKEVNGERIPVAVKTSEYVAEDQQTIVLKPINR